MKISKVRVQNYRSIQNKTIETAKFNVFVGQNNHGKTNFFEAIEWFYNAKSSSTDEHFNKIATNIIEVELFFDEVLESDIEKLTTDANKTKIKTLLGESTSFSVIKSSANDHKRKYFIGEVDKGNPSGLDTAINEFLPKLEYINTKIRLDDVSKYKDRNPIGIMLSGVLTTIIENSSEYTDFRDKFSKLFDDENSEVRKELNKLGSKVEVYLQKQFPDGTSVKFGVNPPEFGDLLKSFDTTVNDGIETKAEEKGDGMQRAIMLSIIQAFADYRKEQNGGGSFLFLIDEAELHLHPSAQRALKKALLEICETDQVFVNTHSSVLVTDDNDCQKIFKVEKIDGITNIDDVSGIDKMSVIYDLLGGSPSDLLLPRNFLIVEGKSDEQFIVNVIKKFYSDKPQIQVIFAEGDIKKQSKSMEAINKVYCPIGQMSPIYRDKLIIMIDKPCQEKEKDKQNFLTAYSHLTSQGQFFELPNESIEEYYPQKWKKTADGVKELDKIQNGKIIYAREVAQSISKDEFEKEMPKIFEALNKCWSLAY